MEMLNRCFMCHVLTSSDRFCSHDCLENYRKLDTTYEPTPKLQRITDLGDDVFLVEAVKIEGNK